MGSVDPLIRTSDPKKVEPGESAATEIVPRRFPEEASGHKFTRSTSTKAIDTTPIYTTHINRLKLAARPTPLSAQANI